MIKLVMIHNVVWDEHFTKENFHPVYQVYLPKLSYPV